MRTTDTSEAGLEALIVAHLTATAPSSDPSDVSVKDKPSLYSVAGGYVQGDPRDYNRDVALDTVKLLAFLESTQRRIVEQLELGYEGIKQTQFLHRLQGEIAKRGVVDVLRKGVQHGPAHIDLYKFLPTPGNATSYENFDKNIFSITRQVRYSKDESQLALDLVLFINGLPLATFELKNRLTKQTVADAVTQYQQDREPRELLFHFGRCMAHFAVDDQEVRFCTHLTGTSSWFLPFNKGWNDGAGNPPNPNGLKTDYFWKDILARESLANIIENYAQIVEEDDEKGRKKRKQVFPRFHQLRTVRALLSWVKSAGVGKRYLIQHSAGSGKSNTIAWLAHQLVGLKQKGLPDEKEIFDSVIVITDRTQLDKQIAGTIKSYDHVASILGHSTDAAKLKQFLRSGKKIIVTTVQKFPFVLDELGNEHRSHTFAIVIDEAHSSQGGRTTAKMHLALTQQHEEEDESVEDVINHIIESRKMLPNASYFAFTATPKPRTLRLFGEEYQEGDEPRFRSPVELTYTTKQAIQERFILDVVLNYTPVASFYRIAKTVEDDPAYDKKKALKKIRRYVESHDTAIQRKAEIMVDHFLEPVVSKRKIGGKARAMIVSAGIARACEYYKAVSEYLAELKSPFKAIVAFSGEHEFNGRKVTEADLNGFPSGKIPQMLKSDPYRFLIVANKFVTGFDEPLLHSMYVDKTLAGVQAVQTLSRLNRAHPQKHDTFVLDFADNAETVKHAFQEYYRATVLVGETDPNTLHDLKNELDAHQVYAWDDVEELVSRYIGGAERDQLDPILDACVATYIETLGEDAQVNFKGNAKAFVRSYGFLAAILPYGHAAWEKLSIFLNFLIPKLPAPKEEDLSRGVLEAIDMDSYRPEVRAALSLSMEDKEGEVEPAPTGGGGTRPEPEIDRLSNIIKTFNEQFGNIAWKDGDKIREVIAKELPTRVAADKAYQNAIKQSDRQNARVEHDKALGRVILDLLSDHTELFKQFSDNPSFKRWLADSIFDVTYRPAIDKSGELINWWKNAATSRIKERFGGAAKWAGIVDALSEHFAARTDDPVMFTDIERIAALCEVPIEDIVTVLHVLAADDVKLVESTYSKFDESEGLLREVSPSEIRTGLSGLSAPGVLGDNAISLAGNVLVGWRPLRNREKSRRMDN
ncbi:MAG: type I restriction endonuclease subunit R [Geobacteraceae bacterium]|nr:type I restriction endonuclease subunit R [Geobacteraceae bacterium]